jgi:hypothetical protein
LTDVTFIHAVNQQRPTQAQQSREAALRQIEQLLTSTILAKEMTTALRMRLSGAT